MRALHGSFRVIAVAAGIAAVSAGSVAAAGVVSSQGAPASVGQALRQGGSAAPRSVLAQEFAAGAPVVRNGLEIAANYLLGIQLDLDALMPMPMGQPDAIHLEADVHAAPGNQHGFDAGDWVPYLAVSYHVAKVGSDWSATGVFQPMVAKDGPHYAANTRLNGPGQYRLTYHLDPPITQGFFRHTDAATGVAPWWEPFEVSWTFTYPSAPRD